MKNQPKAYLGLQESPITPYAATFDHTTVLDFIWMIRLELLQKDGLFSPCLFF